MKAPLASLFNLYSMKNIFCGGAISEQVTYARYSS